MHTTEQLIALWLEARTRFTNVLNQLTEEDLTKKLGDFPNSPGFLIRHIGDVERLFAKNVFGAKDVKVIAKTVIDKRDTGEWSNLDELKAYVEESRRLLEDIVSEQSESDWEEFIATHEFGTKTKAEAFGRIVSHTTYHAGQLAIVKKYGIQP
jgi:uncharacterized damage-inducible protein DinB